MIRSVHVLEAVVFFVCLPLPTTTSALVLSVSSRRSVLVGTRSVGAAAALVLGGTSIVGSIGAPSPAFAASTNNGQKYHHRLEDDSLTMPAPSSSASEFNGIDNTYFPSFLEGNWDVVQTLVDTKTPLGLKFLGGPNGELGIAERTMKEAEGALNKPVSFQLRYLRTKWGVAEDRLFNTQQRLNAFAGKSVVASVQYANVGGSNRQSVLALGGSEDDPLQTTLVYFKGPAAQKNFLVSHGGGSTNIPGTTTNVSNNENTNDVVLGRWCGYELQRSIFALTNQSTAPPITTDSEYIWNFEQLDSRRVQGKLRIVGYLNAQSDKLYFEARNRGVSIQDYTLTMVKGTDKAAPDR